MQKRLRILRLPKIVEVFWYGYCALGVLLIASRTSWGQTFDLETILEKMQQTYEQTKALTADFHQVATLSSLGRQQISSGRVYIEKPHSIRWEYVTPDTQTILYDGTTLRIYTPKRRQMLQSPVDEQNRSNVALLFLAGMGKLRETFTVTALESPSPHLASMLLIPRSTQAGFSELHIAVNTQSYLVETLLIHDSIGNLTEIRLTTLVSHMMLPPKTFELILPPDTEILTPTDFTGRK